MGEQLRALTEFATKVFGGTRLWPLAEIGLLSVFMAACVRLTDRLLPDWARALTRAAAIRLASDARRGWGALRACWNPAYAVEPRWVKPASLVWDLVVGTCFALYCFAWFVLLTAVAFLAQGPAVSVSKRALALALALGLLAAARVCANTARDGFYRLRHRVWRAGPPARAA